jgi:hypothetical protein
MTSKVTHADGASLRKYVARQGRGRELTDPGIRALPDCLCESVSFGVHRSKEYLCDHVIGSWLRGIGTERRT